MSSKFLSPPDESLCNTVEQDCMMWFAVCFSVLTNKEGLLRQYVTHDCLVTHKKKKKSCSSTCTNLTGSLNNLQKRASRGAESRT